MRIALDIMGGDYGPDEIIQGGLEAMSAYDFIQKIYFVGDFTKTTVAIVPSEQIELVQTDEYFLMSDHPATAYREKKQASITIATKLVKDGHADAVVSAGSTGAQMVAALFGLGRIPGISRPAIGVLLPTLRGRKLLMDAGANAKVHADHLVQFALMGNTYMQSVYHIEAPTIALINNGSEATKGPEFVQEAYQKLLTQSQLNFIGNVEGRDIPQGIVDIMLCDGFTGNIVLKTLEGMGKTMFSFLKTEIKQSFRAKIGALLLKPVFTGLKNLMDDSKIGGAPLFGVNGISIVCHGHSKAPAIKNAIFVAGQCHQECFIEKITLAVQEKTTMED